MCQGAVLQILARMAKVLLEIYSTALIILGLKTLFHGKNK
jgi:hypothetical protein